MRQQSTLALVTLAAAALAGGCTSTAVDPDRAARERPTDPKKGEVELPALAGWRGTLVLDQAPVGVWTVMPMKVFPQFGCPEIVALDDVGRLHVLWSYSGKWTPITTVHDGKWLGGIALADVDPRVPGDELYTGSQNGNVYQVTRHLEAFLDSRIVAQIPGHEIHTVLAGDFDKTREGAELLVFTRPGRLLVMKPRTDGMDGFEAVINVPIASRIRDAIVLPAVGDEAPEVVTVGRHGRLESLRFEGGRPIFTTIHEVPMGLGRVALKKQSASETGTVLYTVSDDGRVFRHERNDGPWSSELIYAGAQGTRGCAAGRFDADPNVETVAVFGYNGVVELLSRRDGVWSVEPIFEDLDKGHWLCAGEFDGRNATDELVSAGYSGRVVLLSRPPGDGLPGVLAVQPR